MRFDLVTLGGEKFSGDIAQVSLTTADGDIGILPNHAPMTAIVKPGPVTVYAKGGKTQVFATFGGLIEVTAAGVRLLADEAEHEEELVQAEIEAALKAAEALKDQAKDKQELSRAQELVDRQTVRLGVSRIRRRSHERRR